VNKWQSDWYNFLPIIEFQHNNYIYSLVQQPLFLLNTRWFPWIGFEPQQQKYKLESILKFMERMKFMLKEAKSAIQKSHKDIAKYYNQH